jgi:hypothetical protein
MTSQVRLLLILCVLIASCGKSSSQPSPELLANARRELEARGREDQKVREHFGEGGRLDSAQIVAMMRVDSANTNWLKAYVAKWGWPTRAQVGKEGVDAAFLIVQHATADTAFMRSMLPSITEAYHRGELDGNAVAMLTDRVEVKAGRPQIYGTQLSFHDGKWLLDPLMDSAHIDERRAKMGLSPLSVYLYKIDSMMREQ